VEEQKEPTEKLSVSNGLVRFGPYEVDRRTGEFRKHDQRIRLAGQPFEVLNLLLERPGAVVTREELQQRLWRGETFVDFERSLNSAVKKLRGALNDDPQNPRYIETLPRKGYRFIGTIEPRPAMTTEPAEGESAALSIPHPGVPNDLHVPTDQAIVQEPTAELSSRHRIAILVMGIAALIVVSTLVIYRANRKMRLAPVVASSRNLNSRSSIAVLGFKNFSSGHDADWLSTAITQMLSTELASGGRVRIIPEETVARSKLDLGLKEKDGYPRDSLRALRADLGSDYVVTGSYLALGNRNSGQVRIDLRLQETISGETLASIAVRGKQTEIFDLLARAGQELRIKLGATVPPEGDVDWRSVLPSDPEAAMLYSEGLAHLRVFENLQARELLQKSIALEGNFALAHAALADAWSALGFDARALSSAQKALSLSSALPEDERLAIEGRYYELNHDWAGAVGVYRHLWQDFPDDLESGLKLAAAQTSAGDLNQPLATLSALRSLPAPEGNDPRIDLAEATIAARNGDYKRQQLLASQAERKAESSGARLLLARAKLVQGWALDDQSDLRGALDAYSIARTIFEKAVDGEGVATVLNDMGIVLQKQGRLAEAQEKLEEAKQDFRQLGDQNGAASVLTNLGEVYRAQGALAKAEGPYREALAIFRENGRKENEYTTMNNLGGLLFQEGNFHSAKKLFEDLLEARKAQNDKIGIAFATTNLADMYRIEGDFQRSIDLHSAALATFRESGDRATSAAVQLSLARAFIARHDWAAARSNLQQALVTNQQIGAKGDAALDRVLLAKLGIEEGYPEQFDDAARSSVAELGAEQRGADEMEALAIQAAALLGQKKIDQAWNTLQKAEIIQNADWLAKFHLSLVSAKVTAARGNTEAAKRQLESAEGNAKRVGCTLCQAEVRTLAARLQTSDLPVSKSPVPKSLSELSAP